MSEENKAIARRDYEEIWNNKNLDAIDDLYEPDHIRRGGLGEPGNDGYRQFVTLYTDAFPDLHFTVEDIFAEGSKVVIRWTANGTHKGDLPDIPATGTLVTVTGISIYTLKNGKIVEEWGQWDSLGLMQQLGVLEQ